ncbi:MAG TPA: hypothetical protein ENJ53_04330, partial [Phaeodactylibacter sp.]|nr:hypothetical protein [Phaeodactylibacter sp.]
MKKILFVFILFFAAMVFSSLQSIHSPLVEASKEDAVSEILKKLGDAPIQHQPNLIKGASAEVGRDLALYGIAKKRNGRKTKKQSKHFVCTSCHNIVKDKPDLRVSDPQAKLEYDVKNGIPFLQGT